MKLREVEIRNVKNFTGLNIFSFDPNVNINTISGTNGSGKTTIFKCVQLCQKAFFLSQFNGLEDNYDFLKEKLFLMAENYLSSQDSYIKVTFLIDEQEYALKIYIKNKKLELELDNEARIKIGKYWNINDPASIILIIDASKSFSNENIEYSNISINPYSKKELIKKCIFQPEEIFSYMYQTVVKDYIHERIIPAKPPRYFYFNVATKLMSLLMENVKISNFSANAIHDQFVVLGKTNSTSKMFDIRDFSSGEKALFFILLFICYIPNIGMLVIDEPENHFHEDLLNKFVTVLNGIAKSENFALWIKSNIKDVNESWLIDYYKHNLKQIFFLTHSKNLIYNNFSYGKNYIVNKGMNEITYANGENTLRQIGLSTVYSKVLFVEGKDDYNFLQNILAPHNIKVKPLGNSNEVIETFKKISNVHQYLHDSIFCFLVDNDNKTDSFFEDLQNTNKELYNKYFFKLDRHEFENYLLESDLFYNVLQVYKHETIILPELNEIEEKFFELASAHSDISIRKEVSFKIEQMLSYHLAPKTSGNKNLSFSNKIKLEEELSKVLLDQSLMKQLISEISVEHENILSNYENENWKQNWKIKCDGKIVFKRAVDYFSNMIKIGKDRLEFDLQKELLRNEKLEGTKLVKKIIKAYATK